MRPETLDTDAAAGSSRTPAQGGGKLTYRLSAMRFEVPSWAKGTPPPI